MSNRVRERPAFGASSDVPGFGLLCRIVAAFSLGAGAIHLGVVQEHLNEGVLFGLFFFVVGFGQVVTGALVVLTPSRSLLRLVVVGNVGVIGLWLVTRTVGLPFGPSPGVPEHLAFADGAASLFEAVIVTWAVAALRPGALARTVARRVATAWTAGVTVVVGIATFVAVAGQGESGGVLRGPAASATAAPGLHSAGGHALHVVIIGGAAVAYALYVAVYVWENGWPRFSWRLEPRFADETAPAAESMRARVHRLGEGDPQQVR